MTMTDIKPKWLNLIRRLQSMARNQSGVACISLTVLVDADGNPLIWETPDITTFEPKIEAERVLATLLAQARNQ
jgi:hypothetical protein